MNKDFLSKNKKYLVAIFLLVVSAVMISLGNDNSFNKTISNGVNLTTAIPIYISNEISDYFNYIFNSLYEINQLKQSLEESNEKIRKYEKHYIELDKYKKSVKKEIRNFILTNNDNKEINPNTLIEKVFSIDNNDYKMEQAEIISHGINDFFSTIIINKGSLDGIKPGMPVIAFQDGYKGVVGRVIDTTLNHSKILPLHKNGSDIGAVIEETGYVGIVSGNDNINELELNYIDKRSKLEKGYKIKTIGEDSIFPKNIRIGEIIEVLPIENEFYKSAIINPYIQIMRLHEVFIIKRLPDNEIKKLKEED